MLYLLTSRDFDTSGAIRKGAGALADSAIWNASWREPMDLSNDLTLVIISSKNCPFCVALKPIIQSLAKRCNVALIEDDPTFIQLIQSDKTPLQIPEGKYPYSGVPIITAFKYGRFVDAFVNTPRTETNIYKWLSQYQGV